MGLLGKIFSSKPDFPAIDPGSTAAERVARVEEQLHDLAGKVKEPLEVVPAEQAAYVFIGKPPKKFGLAWIHDGKVSGLNTLYINMTDAGGPSGLLFSTTITTVAGDEVALPEPGMIAIFGLGLVGLGLARRRRAS